MSKTLVTIGVPVYNGADYLDVAMDALLAQTHKNLEILIADNDSTDDSLAIAEQYAAADARVTVLRATENRGAAWNYNRVVEVANGTYFKWAAHDDICLPTYIERCADALDNDDATALAYPKTIIIDGSGDARKDYEDGLNLDGTSSIRRGAALLWRVGLCNAVFGVMRTTDLRGTGMIQSFDSSDISLLAELALRGKFHEVDERLFLRRRHEAASRSANTSTEEVAAWFGPDAKSGRSVSLNKAYQAAVWRWDANIGRRIAAAAMFAAVGPLVELRWHRRMRRRRRSSD